MQITLLCERFRETHVYGKQREVIRHEVYLNGTRQGPIGTRLWPPVIQTLMFLEPLLAFLAGVLWALSFLGVALLVVVGYAVNKLLTRLGKSELNWEWNGRLTWQINFEDQKTQTTF